MGSCATGGLLYMLLPWEKPPPNKNDRITIDIDTFQCMNFTKYYLEWIVITITPYFYPN